MPVGQRYPSAEAGGLVLSAECFLICYRWTIRRWQSDTSISEKEIRQLNTKSGERLDVVQMYHWIREKSLGDLLADKVFLDFHGIQK